MTTEVLKAPDKTVELTGRSRYGQIEFVSYWRLPPVAHAWRWAASVILCDF